MYGQLTYHEVGEMIQFGRASEVLRIGAPAIIPLIELLYSHNYPMVVEVTRETLQSIIKTDPNAASFPLIEVLTDDNNSGRQATAAEILIPIADLLPESVLQALGVCLGSWNLSGREAAVKALSKAGLPAVPIAINVLLSSEFYSICQKAAETLGNLGEYHPIPEAVEPLILLLGGKPGFSDHDRLILRHEIVDSLAKLSKQMKIPQAVKPIMDLFNAEKNDIVRRWYAVALSEICKGLSDPNILDLVAPILKDRDFDIRRTGFSILGNFSISASWVLGKIRKENDIRIYVQIISHFNESQVSEMLRLLQDEDPYLQKAVLGIFVANWLGVHMGRAPHLEEEESMNVGSGEQAGLRNITTIFKIFLPLAKTIDYWSEQEEANYLVQTSKFYGLVSDRLNRKKGIVELGAAASSDLRLKPPRNDGLFRQAPQKRIIIG